MTRMTDRRTFLKALAATGAMAALVALAMATLSAQGRGAAPPAAAPPTPRAGALFDITGYWVSLVTEDWRYRQFTPAKGDYVSVPLRSEERRVGKESVARGW